MTTDAVNKKRPQKTGGVLLEFFGSMNLAITLLVTVGIASIVGTVLKQNEPYQNYISKFGPFWFEVFNSLGLYDVYSAAWFLLIHDPQAAAPVEATIAVNYPLIYKGYTIYQASFSDGGSKLDLRLWPLLGSDGAPEDVKGAVFEDIDFEASTGPLTLELINFRLFNINQVMQEGTGKKFRNFGPNFSFKLRNELGEAIVYENYMLPVDMEGHQYFLSGVRRTPAEPFQYLYIPADPDGGIERFMQFNTRLHDLERITAIARGTAGQSVSPTQIGNETFVDELTESMARLVTLFTAKGFDGVVEQVDTSVPEAERASVLDAYLKVLQTMLASLYTELLADNGVDLSQGISERDCILTVSCKGRHDESRA